VKEGKMNRFITFFEDCGKKDIGTRAIYGDEDALTSLSQNQLEKWYVEYKSEN